MNFRSGLIKRLIEEGYDVHVCAPLDKHRQSLESLGCNFHSLSMNNKGTSPLEDLKLIKSYVALMKVIRPDAYLGFTIKPNVYGNIAAHRCGVPTINNVSGLGTVFIRKSWITFIVKRLYKKALKKSYRVFFQNNDDLALFLDEGLVERENTAILPGSGVNLQYFSHSPYEPKPEPKFLLIARILRDKGVLEYVEAARILKAKNYPATFQLLGFLDAVNKTAIPKADVEGWVNEGLIEFLGAQDDVRPYLKAVDCVVLPSYREGTPRSLLEAAATGRPIITTDVPGCREVVRNGYNGFLCEVRNGADLAAKMIEFIKLSPAVCIKMGQQSRFYAETLFDENIVIERYMDVILKLVPKEL